MKFKKCNSKDKTTIPKEHIEATLQLIRNFLIDNVFRNPNYYFPTSTDDVDTTQDALVIIAGLYELLHVTLTGEEYDYFWHYGNRVTGTIPFRTNDFIKRVAKWTLHKENKDD